jgi:hypothetical protein
LRLRALYKNKACAHCRVCFVLWTEYSSPESANVCSLARPNPAM